MDGIFYFLLIVKKKTLILDLDETLIHSVLDKKKIKNTKTLIRLDDGTIVIITFFP